jgi:hypothetical protein
MQVKTLVIALLASSAAIVVVVLSPLYKKPSEPAPIEVIVPDIPAELNVNFRTASYECSHHGKQWHICTQPDGWGSMFYCPTYSDYNETELALVEASFIGEPTPLMPCFTCPEEGSDCSTVVSEVMTAAGIAEDQNSTLWNWNIWDEAIYYCKELCEKNKEGESCSEVSQCTTGELFCDYDPDDTKLVDGTCRKCPTDHDMCMEEGFAASVQGQKNCKSCTLSCYGAETSKLLVDGEVLSSQPLDGAIQASHQNASGQLYDCSILAADPHNTCPGAEGKVCLIHFNDQNIEFFSWHISNQLEESGCLGVIAFIEGFNGPVNFDNDDTPLLIPFVFIENGEGISLMQSKIGSNATIQVDVLGVGCYPPDSGRDICRGDWHCKDGDFCVYYDRLVGPDTYNEGYCDPCPSDAHGDPDPLACYFDEDLFKINLQYDTVQNVNSCASSCGAEAALMTKSCKFCPSDLTKFEFGIKKKEERCIFCPESNLQFPDRTISLFGKTPNTSCDQMESFFQRMPVPNDSTNCQLAQSMNYVCGCDGIGYAGANTQTKRNALVWMPRVAAVLSILVRLHSLLKVSQSHILIK